MVNANIVNTRKEIHLNNGMRNLGFNLLESIMESVDDALDASLENNINNEQKQVHIYIYKEEFKENEIETFRYSYAILDNGPGTSVDEVFDFGKSKGNRYLNTFALNNLNGVFHYGLVSHLNVANRLNFYSREKNKKWWLHKLDYNELTEKAMSIKENKIPSIKYNGIQSFLDNETFTVRTIVHVQGVRKSELGTADIKKLELNLTKQLGITYRNYLEEGVEILVNDVKVLPLDPFMRDSKYVEIGLQSDLFLTFDILLSELLDIEEDAIVRQEIYNKFLRLFVTEKELLDQSITIKMYHLDKDFKHGNIIKQVVSKTETKDTILPSGVDSGFYIRRNQRYIGRAAKILNICTSHNSFNYFRAEIVFSPIFDSFFGIQINKNRYDIKNSLGNLLISKMESEIGKLSSFLKDRYTGKGYKINPSVEFELKRQYNISRKSAIHLDRVTAGAIEIGVNAEIISEAKASSINLLTFAEKLLSNLNQLSEIKSTEIPNQIEIAMLERLAKVLISKVLEIIQEADEVLIRLEAAISTRNEELIFSVIKLKERVNSAVNSKRKLLQTVDYDKPNEFQGFILEPLNEVQLYGVLLTLVQHFPDRFYFVLLDYSENDHLDCLVKIKQPEVYKLLNIKERFENQWNEQWDDFLLNNSGGYNFVELKYLLGERKELGHSLALVSHLVCWDFSKDITDEFIAKDGKYKLSKDKVYLLHNDKRKKVKIVCLKDYVEELLGQDLSVSQEKFNNYLNI